MPEEYSLVLIHFDFFVQVIAPLVSILFEDEVYCGYRVGGSSCVTSGHFAVLPQYQPLVAMAGRFTLAVLRFRVLQENLMDTWEKERGRVGKVQELKERLDALKVEIEHAERGYDLNKAAELKYSVMPKLQVRDIIDRDTLAFIPNFSQSLVGFRDDKVARALPST